MKSTHRIAIQLLNLNAGIIQLLGTCSPMDNSLSVASNDIGLYPGPFRAMIMHLFSILFVRIFNFLTLCLN